MASSPSRSMLGEFGRVWNIVLPSALGNLCEYLPVCTAIAVVGHLSASPSASSSWALSLGSSLRPLLFSHHILPREPAGGESSSSLALAEGGAVELDALALARAYFNMVLMAPGFGCISALRTLCPQAVGAGQHASCALHLQRALLLIVGWFALALPLLLYAERIMLAAGQRADLAALAAPYVLRLAPSYFGVTGMSAVQRIFQANELNWANLIITALVCALAPPLQWLLVHTLGFGYLGAAWAQSIYNALYFVFQVPYLCWCGFGYVFKPQGPRRLLASNGMWEHLKLAAPGFWMVVLEWWMCEVVVLLAGLLAAPTASIGAMTIVANLQALGAMAWIGLAVASSTLVGQHIGSGRVAEARRAAVLALAVGTIIAGVCACAILAAPRALALAFTADESIVNLTTALLPLLAAILFVDATSNGLGGVCSGLGLQRVSAVGQLVGNYVVGLPLGTTLAFVAVRGVESGVLFLWGSVGLSMLTAAAVQLVALLRLDWNVAARRAEERLACDLPTCREDFAEPVTPPANGGLPQRLVTTVPARATGQLSERLLLDQGDCSHESGSA